MISLIAFKWISTSSRFRISSGYVLLFLRLQIYEAIAAIFWQSASYVENIVNNGKGFLNRVLLFK